MMKLFEKIDGGLQCLLCPHLCILKDGEIGKCHARHSRDGEPKHIYLGSISCLAVEPIEKKPFKHFLQGTKTLTYGSYGCNLNCKFCESDCISQISPPSTAHFAGHSNLIPMAKEKRCKSISMSYNEPILSYELLIDLAENCAKNDLKFILKTNAFVNKEPWKEICLRTSAMNIDWKGDEKAFKKVTRVDSYVLKDRIKEAYDLGVHIEISLPLYYLDDEFEEQINIFGEFISSIDKSIPCHLLRISPSYKYSDFIFNSENLEKAKDILSKYDIENVYTVI